MPSGISSFTGQQETYVEYESGAEVKKLNQNSTGTTVCNVDLEWCEEGREGKRKRNWGEGGIYNLPVKDRKELGSTSFGKKGRHLIWEVRGYFNLGRCPGVYTKDHDI